MTPVIGLLDCISGVSTTAQLPYSDQNTIWYSGPLSSSLYCLSWHHRGTPKIPQKHMGCVGSTFGNHMFSGKLLTSSVEAFRTRAYTRDGFGSQSWS